MKNFIRFLFLIFFFFVTLDADANICADFSFIEKQTQKVESISAKQNQTIIEISKKQDNFFIKNEENTEFSILNFQRNNGQNRGNVDFFVEPFFINKDNNLISDNFNFRINYSISPTLIYSINTRAP